MVVGVGELALAVAIQWQPCPVYTPVTAGGMWSMDVLTPMGWAGKADAKAECSTLAVPLLHAPSDERTIKFFVKRIKATKQPPQGEIWFLNGGPGLSGVSLEAAAAYQHRLADGAFDVLLPDLRGTFRSTGLEYNDTDTFDKMLGNLVRVKGLDYAHAFSTTNSAKDIHFAMKEIGSQASRKKSDYNVMLYADSFGTFVAQRFLLLYPEAFDAVVMDGYLAPDVHSRASYEMEHNSVGVAFIEDCAADSSCLSHFSMEHPLLEVQLVVTDLQSGLLKCAEKLDNLLTPVILQSLFATMVEDPSQRLLILPIIKRLRRCDDDDVKALKHLLTLPPAVLPPSTYNFLLMTIVINGDWFAGDTTSCQQLEALKSGLMFPSAVPAEGSACLLQELPGYRAYTDPLNSAGYPDTKVAMLIVQGQEDANTPPMYAQRAERVYNRKDQHVVRVPHSVHITATLPGRSTTLSGEDCSPSIVASFFASRGRKVDTSCLSQLAPPDFEGESPFTQFASVTMLGTPDMWGSRDAVDLIEERAVSWWYGPMLVAAVLLVAVACKLKLTRSGQADVYHYVEA